ncbi:uncharacterized protein EI90DRAFT_2935528, partial [Cantharellus anzutake]|uniref:uncharacterized protein n=1 Tax=Cantharellus anzutake TaxID=1750568 RepID=UPI0019079BEE
MTIPRQEILKSTPVYPVIQQIREDLIHYIDNPLSYEALTAPDLTYTLVRPLAEKYNKLQNMAIPFCLLLNRANFMRDKDIATRSVSLSRAALCEILAIRAIRYWANETLELAMVMTTSWVIFAGADEEVLSKVNDDREDTIDMDLRLGNAIEMAVLSDAKRFIKSSASQKVINGIWTGEIIYTPESDHAILSDTYKRAPVHFYDPLRAPLLDHYRLKVPAIRAVLDYLNFLLLFILFVLFLETNELGRINIFEWAFIIYGLGFTVDRLASMQEHGLKCTSTFLDILWNGFDLAFIVTYLPYITLRFYGAREHKSWASELSIDIVSISGVFMFPRIAFVSLSNNLMVLSLRSMFVQFFQLMALAMWCFGGFLYALWTFGKSRQVVSMLRTPLALLLPRRYTAAQIAWWMADLWFGLDASGFELASTFHPVFGPPLMAVYACCSNTLLLTAIFHQILSQTFSTLSADAEAEVSFFGVWPQRRSMLQHIHIYINSSLTRVKADALFSYQPPLNLFAFLVMWPLSFILNARWFHKVNVLMIRITAFPILLSIGLYERLSRSRPPKTLERASHLLDMLPRGLRPLSFLEGLAGQGSRIEAVFEIEAKVVDDQLNSSNLQRGYEPDRQSQEIDIPSKPHSPAQSTSSSPAK